MDGGDVGDVLEVGDEGGGEPGRGVAEGEGDGEDGGRGDGGVDGCRAVVEDGPVRDARGIRERVEGSEVAKEDEGESGGEESDEVAG